MLTFGQVVIGVALGAQLTSGTLRAVAGDWLPITVITVATLLISLAAGLLLSRATGLDRPTALLGLIAGGASGIVAMADELGADARLVAFMQYLRVLIVVITAPLVATVLFGAGGDALAPGAGGAGLAADLAFTAGCGVAGLLIARRAPITAGSLLVPLVIAGRAVGQRAHRRRPRPRPRAGPRLRRHRPPGRAALHGRDDPAGRPPAAGRRGRASRAMIVACGGLALLVLFVTDVSFSDAYLATTPGGLYAGARRGDRRRRERRLRARGPGAAPVRDDPRGAPARAPDHALRYNASGERGPAPLPDVRPARQRGAGRAGARLGVPQRRRARSTARPSAATMRDEERTGAS